MNRTVAMLLVIAVIAVLFAGCSQTGTHRSKTDDDEQSDTPFPVGTFHVSTIDGKRPNAYFRKLFSEYGEAGFQQWLHEVGLNEVELNRKFCILEMKNDGNFLFESQFPRQTIEGTWKMDGDVVTLVSEWEEMEV